MSKCEKKLIKPPRSPPMSIPPKRTVYNSFFPEPTRQQCVVTRFQILQNNKLKFNKLKDELEIYKRDLIIFKDLQKGEKLGKQITKDDIEKKEGIDKKTIKEPGKEGKEEIKEEIEEEIEEDKKQENKEIKQYYKQQPYTGMWITRWWYSESRGKTIEYLDEDFTNFMNYLDRILNNILCDPKGVYVSLIKAIREFINDIIPGLYNLKQTYSDSVKMVAKVDSIILTLLDFKEKTDDYLTQKKQNVRLTVKSRKIPVEVVRNTYDDMPSNSI